MRRRVGLVLGAATTTLLLSGCGGAGQPDPTRAAEAFEAAVGGGDADAACALLAVATLEELEQSSGKPCAKSILDEVQAGGGRAAVSRFGTMAQARFATDVLFLTEGPKGWRVLAAGCAPAGGSAPYDCQVSGG